MEIRLRETGQVMQELEFRLYQQSIGGPSWQQTTEAVLNELLADVVFEGPQAQPTRYQVAFRDGVEQLADGKWYTKYSVADMDAEAIAAVDSNQAQQVRQQRNRLLQESDWTQVLDSPVNREQWAQYRQELRDITLQAGFPWTVNWPQQPQ